MERDGYLSSQLGPVKSRTHAKSGLLQKKRAFYCGKVKKFQ